MSAPRTSAARTVTTNHRRPAADLLAVTAVGLAPLLIVLGNGLHPVVADQDVGALLEAVAEDPGRWITARLVYAAGCLLLIPAMATLLSLHPRGLVLVGALLAGVGAGLNALSQALTGYVAYTGVVLDLPREPVGQLLDGFDSGPAGLPVSFLSVPVLVLGLLLVPTGLLISRSAPRAACVLLVVGVLLSAAAQAGPSALLLGAPLVAAFWWLALVTWRRRGVAQPGVAAG